MRILIYIALFFAWNAQAALVTADLNVALFEDSGWTEELANEHLSGVRETYAQCGIDLGKIHFHHVKRAAGTADLAKFDFSHPHGIAAVAEEVKNLPRPLILLVRSIADGQGRPFSRAKFIDLREQQPAALMDTVWLPALINGDEYKRIAPYHVLAHELTHVFTLDGQHNNDTPPNLMTISSRRTNFMSEPLCEALRASRLVRAEKSGVQIFGNAPTREFPELQDQLNKIWDYEQSQFAGKNPPLRPPQIHFYEFDRTRVPADFIEWQNQWLIAQPEIWKQFLNFKRRTDVTVTPEWIAANVQTIFPFPSNFVALFYEGSDRVQVAPAQSYLKHMTTDGYGNKRDGVGYGFYTTAHEMLHYALEQKGIPVKLHHCIFVSPSKGAPSPMAKITQFLIENRLAGPAINMFGLRAEESMRPCSALSDAERDEAAQAAAAI